MPSSDKQIIERHFSRQAHHYDRVTPVQQRMGAELLSLVAGAAGSPAPRRILELGCGTGGMTAGLHGAFPRAVLTAVDLSSAMIDLARCRPELRDCDTVEWIVGDAEALIDSCTGPGSGMYDLIAANAAVQWFNDPAAVMQRCAGLVRNGGLLAFSTFGLRTFHELDQSFREAAGRIGWGPETYVLPMAESAMWRHQFQDRRRFSCRIEERMVTEYYPGVRDLLAAIRDSGASTAHRRRPMSRALYRQMACVYESRFGDPHTGFIPATYHTVLVLVKCQ